MHTHPSITLPPWSAQEADQWGAPFVMEGCNARIVQLSAALAPKPYGSDFKYQEQVGCGKGWTGWLGAGAVAAATGLLGLTVALAPGRWLLRKWVNRSLRGLNPACLPAVCSWALDLAACAPSYPSPVH